MKWTAEQIREWFERGRAEERPVSVIDAHKPTPQGVWVTEARQWLTEELDELHARHIDV